MISAAMSNDKFDKTHSDGLTSLGSLRMSSYAIPRIAQKGDWELPVKRLEDYHTLGAHYNHRDPVDKWNCPRKASGAFSPNAVVTKRDYLLDAAFLIVFRGEPSLLRRVQQALSDPKWGIWFGRKCCLPASPVFPVFGDQEDTVAEEVLARFPKLKKAPLESYDRVIESNETDGTLQMDQPVNFGSRDYATRPVKHYHAGESGEARS